MSTNPSPGKFLTVVAAIVALVAFAANSLLCRQALGAGTIDAAGFASIRLLSGAVALLGLSAISGRRSGGRQGSWGTALSLFVYAFAFSFAYLTLSTGTGALALFGAVQLTMILAGLRSGERPGMAGWCGLLLALAGLVVLVLPGVSAPSPTGLLLMIAAGIAWGIYSLSGRGNQDPLAVTTANFVRSLPFALVISLIMLPALHLSGRGVILAVLSGALASAGGYVVWYAALRGMTATLAATVQLVVPVLAAAGGVCFLSERISSRLVWASVAILGGVALAVAGRSGSRRE